MKLSSSGYGAILRGSSGFRSRKWNLLYSSTATSTDSLYSRISPRGHPEGSIVPVLDQWVEDGRDVHKHDLHNIVRELRRYSRFKHALEVSEWMSDKRFLPLTKRDMAARLDLISKVHGTEEAENYFNNIAPAFKDMETYGILLNCYARSRLVEKAEATMQKMKDLGFMTTTLSYNVMINLYRQTGDNEKLNLVLREMEEKGVGFDRFTFGTILSAYAEKSDIEGLNKTLQQMDSYPKAYFDWASYSIASNGFYKAGDIEKASAMLKKSEELVKTIKVKGSAYDYILSQYATLGRKDEVMRLWESRKKAEKLLNKSYITMISSLLKFDDVEGAELVFEDWESRELTYDFRVPNFLVGIYCRKGHMEKAEEFIKRAVARGGVPLALTWYFMASGYVSTNEMSKAAEAMKVAVSSCKTGWKPSASTLASCLEYLKEKGDSEDATEFLRLLASKEIVSSDVHDKLSFYVKDSKSSEDAPVGNRNALEILMGQQGV